MGELKKNDTYHGQLEDELMKITYIIVEWVIGQSKGNWRISLAEAGSAGWAIQMKRIHITWGGWRVGGQAHVLVIAENVSQHNL